MPGTRMHADEWPIDADLVGRLVAGQFPQWSDRSLQPVPSAGTDNALFRLGGDLLVRLPRIPSAAEQLASEQMWLPNLAGRLALDIPEQAAVGEPADGFPWSWSVLRWLEGENADPHRLTDQIGSAEQMARFIGTLQAIDPAGGPAPGRHNAWRGAPLATRADITRESITAMDGVIDTELAAAVWQEALAAPQWDRPGVWVHGDLQPGNVLARDGRISGVIDFGCLGVGDPAYDLLAAWALFDTSGRERFRASLGVDDATWRRGRGWALSFGAMVYPYYRDTNPGLVEIARFTIAQALADAE